MGYKIIYIQQSERLSLYLDNLKVETERGELLVPLSDIQTLIVDNYKTVLTTRLMNALCSNNVCTILCSIDHLPSGYLLPMNGHFSMSGNIMKQVKWDDDIKKALHREIVVAKISNQRKILIKHNGSQYAEDILTKYIQEVQDDDITNREGLAAKVYFRELFGDSFTRFDNDVINAGLNYGYSIFRSLITSIIVSKGYLPNLGIFHRGRENMTNLSDDLIEVFRPIVDDYVCSNMLDDVLFTSKTKEELIRLSVGRIYYENCTETISNAITLYFESILKCIENKDTKYFSYPDCIISYDI